MARGLWVERNDGASEVGRTTRLLGGGGLLASISSAAEFPAAAVDIRETSNRPSLAVLAGGCFWGMEGVFERLKGVGDVVSGFAGGEKATAHYEIVSTGNTGHA